MSGHSIGTGQGLLGCDFWALRFKIAQSRDLAAIWECLERILRFPMRSESRDFFPESLSDLQCPSKAQKTVQGGCATWKKSCALARSGHERPDARIPTRSFSSFVRLCLWAIKHGLSCSRAVCVSFVWFVCLHCETHAATVPHCNQLPAEALRVAPPGAPA